MAKNQTRKPSRDVRGGKGMAGGGMGRAGYGKGSASGSGKGRGSKGGSPTGSKRYGGAGAGSVRGGFAAASAQPKGQGKGRSYKKDVQSGADAIAGKHAVIEALEAGVPLKKVMIAQGIAAGEALEKVRKLASENGVDVDVVPRARIEEKAAGLNHQGIMAVSAPYEYSSIHQIIEAASGVDATLVIVLDHITDVGNFGAIVRTAEVIGACGVVIASKRSVDVVSSTYKTSAGAVSRMNIAKVSNIGNACDALREAGFWVAGASEKAEGACWDSPMHGKLALVMGNEQTGISKLVQQKCDFMVKLPQRGQIGSLNVSCAAAALGYEWMRQSAAEGLLG